MLVSGSQLLEKAREEGNCLPAFNVYNLETIKACFDAAKQTARPLMIAFGEGYLKYTSLEMIVAIVRELDRFHDLPVVLHLDHCKTVDICKKAIDVGFTSVMYDGSHLSFEENIKYTKEVVSYAHFHQVSVEGELGYMNPEDGSASIGLGEEAYTDPQLAITYVKETGIDSLAVVVGNAHGLYHGTPHLEFERLREIYQKVGIPLVLHGASGIDQKQIQKAVKIAVAKINVNTEIALSASNTARNLLESDKKIRFEKVMEEAGKSMTEVMIKFLEMTR